MSKDYETLKELDKPADLLKEFAPRAAAAAPAEAPAEAPVAEEWIAPNQPGTALRNYQEAQLRLLKEFVRICEENGLRWFVAWGTLLGAARHQGFIPWDDDVDVWMPAKDYVAFRDLVMSPDSPLGDDFYFQSHAANPCNFIRWQRIGLKNTTSMPYAYADVHADWGICIDIFGLMPYPGEGDEQGVQAFKERAKHLTQLTNKYIYKHDAKALSGLKKAYHLYRAKGSDEDNIRAWKQAEHDLLFATDYADSDLVTDHFFDEVHLPKHAFEGEPVELKFEDIVVKAPADYEAVLVPAYGEDWMEMPPEEKRVWHSGGGNDEVLVSFDEPWTKFLK